MPATEKLTPMLRHYLEVKSQYPDGVLLYRMGDFFELFFEDAVRAAPIMEVTLTARQKGTESETPMCGVPHHSIESYIGKLLDAGVKAVICDQVEKPSEAKGLVKREVTRVVTPGTVSDPALLDGKEDNLLAAVVWSAEPAAKGAPAKSPDGAGAGAFLDVSTGHFSVRRWESPEEAADALEVLRPREVLVDLDRVPEEVGRWAERRSSVTPLHGFRGGEGDALLDPRRAGEILSRQLGVSTLRGFGLEGGEPAVLAAAAALTYARDTQLSDLAHVRELCVESTADGLVLDPTTLANLEIFRNLREGGKKGTLLSVMDRTVTAPGGRLLRAWLRRPLVDPAAVDQRLQAVEELVLDGPRRERLRSRLAEIGDPERLVSRAVLGTLPPREAAVLRQTLEAAPEILAELAECEASLLAVLSEADPLPELAAELARVLAAEPAANVKDGGVIAPGVDEALDRNRSLARDSKRHILSMEQEERKKTGIGSLKIRFNKVFGYYLEVTNAHLERVPEHYIRKQTLVNAERYVTPEVKELEEQILSAEEKQVELEEAYYEALQRTIAAEAPGLAALARALGTLDVLASFAEVAARNRYVRPRLLPSGEPITIREGRHPVVEQTAGQDFVPNDTDLSNDEAQVVLLTGPNMGGKSTYLRQVALIVLLAQAGSFVPADEAVLGSVDRIFTRVGASDDLARGESTFMVEMIETANILHHATGRSLVILDEVGRGTATFDGLSLAWAIVEYLHENTRPKTLFATHYHELTELATLLPRVVNRKMSVKEWEDRIVFLRRVLPGSADKSYGLDVARLAGLPAAVIDRAGEVLANLEAQEYDFTGKPRLARGTVPKSSRSANQMSLFTSSEQVVADLLREARVEELTPLAALNLLSELKKKLE